MTDVADTMDYRGYGIELFIDPECDSPREYGGNIAVLAQLSRDYTQPDARRCDKPRCPETHNPIVDALVAAWGRYERDTVKVERYARAFLDAAAVDWWDDPGSGSRIVAIATGEAVTREGVTDAADALRVEVNLYAAWATGECYGYRIIRPDGTPDEESGCGGLIGYEWAVRAAKEDIDDLVANPPPPPSPPTLRQSLAAACRRLATWLEQS